MKNLVDDRLQEIKFIRGEQFKGEISAIFKEVNDYYNTRLNLIEEEKRVVSEKIADFLEKIQNYSSFPVNIIGPVLADLFTLYKGQIYKYVVKEIKYEPDIKKRGKYEYLLLNEKDYLDRIFFVVFGGNIEFYNYSGQDSYLVKHYPFIKEFIDYIINYRIENNIIEISEDVIKRLEYDFIELHQDDIKSLYEDRKGEQSYKKLKDKKFD